MNEIFGNPSIHRKITADRKDGSRRSIKLDFHLQDWLVHTAGLTPVERGVLISVIPFMVRQGGAIRLADGRQFRACGFKSQKPFLKIVSELVNLDVLTKDGGFYWASIIDGFDECSALDKIEAGRSYIPAEIRRAVWARDGAECRYCGCTSGPFELDHYHPWSKGGEDTVDNLRVSCAECNRFKSDLLPAQWEAICNG